MTERSPLPGELLLTVVWEQIKQHELLAGVLGILVLLLALMVCHLVIKYILKRLLFRIFHGGDSWAATFAQDRKLTFWVLVLPYLLILYQAIDYFEMFTPRFSEIAHRVITAAWIWAGLLVLTQVCRIFNQLYSRKEIARSRPIKGYLQGIQLVAYLFGIMCTIAVLIDKSPLLLLSGLGALTAVLMLVFKDTILSLVAGIQLTTNDLIRVGDWIEMPQFNADGDVLEITLHNVKVQNWDRTITMIPAHKFLEHSFKNWRGMQESGGRRIKRSLFIDLDSIRFLNEADIEGFMGVSVLCDYLTKKRSELVEHHRVARLSDDAPKANRRRLTNVGTFRAYLSEYLKTHPAIHKGMTFMVRQLQPTPEGLPIEIYVFVNDVRWAVYEGVQADIFDHVLAIMPEFGLRVYQKPSGYDLRAMRMPQSRALPDGVTNHSL